MGISSSILKRGLLFASSATFLLAIFTVSVRPHYWPIVSTAAITYNGKPSGGSRLFRSLTGEFILQLQEPQEYAPYWIVPKSKQVSAANINNFNFLHFAAIVQHTDQYGVDLRDTVKTEIDPNIVAGRNFIEFTSRLKQRVRVAW